MRAVAIELYGSHAHGWKRPTFLRFHPTGDVVCGLFAPPYHWLVLTAVADTGDTVVKLHVHPVYLLHHKPGLSPAKSRNCSRTAATERTRHRPNSTKQSLKHSWKTKEVMADQSNL